MCSPWTFWDIAVWVIVAVIQTLCALLIYNLSIVFDKDSVLYVAIAENLVGFLAIHYFIEECLDSKCCPAGCREPIPTWQARILLMLIALVYCLCIYNMRPSLWNHLAEKWMVSFDSLQ